MPRRKTPDPLARDVGHRVRALRERAGLTLEKLAYESELGSKGHLSDLERGLTRPTVKTLKALADHLGVELLDLVNFPERGARQELIDRTRFLTPGSIGRLLRTTAPAAAAARAAEKRGDDYGTDGPPAPSRGRRKRS